MLTSEFGSLCVLVPAQHADALTSRLPPLLASIRVPDETPVDFVLRVPEMDGRFGLLTDRAGVVLARERSLGVLLDRASAILASALTNPGVGLLARSVTRADGRLAVGPYVQMVGLSFAARQLAVRGAEINPSIIARLDDFGGDRGSVFVYLGDEFDAPPTTMRTVYELASCGRAVSDRQAFLNELVRLCSRSFEVRVLTDQRPGAVAATFAQ